MNHWRKQLISAVALAAVVLSLATGTAMAQGKGLTEIFVRFEDQLFPAGGDYEAFCEQRKDVPRSDNRAHVIAELKRRAESSWTASGEMVNGLEETGDVVDVQRYWIVNGFACRASADAISDIEAHEGVTFVYRPPLPLVPALHARPVQVEAGEEYRKVYQDLLEKWVNDDETPVVVEDSPVAWNVSRIRADEAWNLDATGKGVVVALCDSGLMVTPALMRALWRNPKEELDGEDNDDNGYVDDLFGYDFEAQTWFCLADSPVLPHGSACGGIIAGRPLNSEHIFTGVAPRARLMMLRGMGFLKAYEYALEQGADVMSMSYMWVQRPLGDYRGLYRLAHEHLAAGGIVAVGGAGNFRQNKPAGQQIALPKDIPCVIAAAGILQDGKQAAFSSEGPCFWNDVPFYEDYPPDAPLHKPDVTGVAGGYPVWWRTTRRQRGWKVVSDEGNGIGLVTGPQGNSFSGPHVAGVAALVLSVHPELNSWQVKQIIESTCRDLGDEGWDAQYGHGLLDAAAAARAARQAD